MADWTRCDRCRRVLPSGDFDGGSPTCLACLSTPVKAVRAPRSTTVTTRRKAPAPAEDGPRRPLLGVAGSGDLEMRERRARRKALDALAETHVEDFEHLLQQSRRDEGLRS